MDGGAGAAILYPKSNTSYKSTTSSNYDRQRAIWGSEEGLRVPCAASNEEVLDVHRGAVGHAALAPVVRLGRMDTA
jgi:hypothetical protein